MSIKIPQENFIEVTPSTWNDAKEIGKSLTLSIFRGQSSNKWSLSTTIERSAKRHMCSAEEVWLREKYVLQSFKARAHHFLSSPPIESENIEWLSIIQDYGGPTRLLDFTESFYIASFFAIDSTIDDDACVWAISNTQLMTVASHVKDIGLESNKRHYYDSESILRFAESLIIDRQKSMDLVLRVTPPRLNERLATQKGVFLLPARLERSFENNLCATFNLSFETLDSSNACHLESKDLLSIPNIDLAIPIIKINLPRNIHDDALRDLYSMNIDSATLFPGLDGFARSLNYYIQQAQPTFRFIRPASLPIPKSNKPST